MSSLTPENVKKIAHLARLSLTKNEMDAYTDQLSRILTFVEQINAVDTNDIEPLAHPLEIAQRMRADEVTEKNERESFQAIAPAVDAGLYLVPKVIDEA